MSKEINNKSTGKTSEKVALGRTTPTPTNVLKQATVVKTNSNNKK